MTTPAEEVMLKVCIPAMILCPLLEWGVLPLVRLWLWRRGR